MKMTKYAATAFKESMEEFLICSLFSEMKSKFFLFLFSPSCILEVIMESMNTKGDL